VSEIESIAVVPPARPGCRDVAQVLMEVVLTLARERAEDGRIALDSLERIAVLVTQGNLLLDETFARQQELCRQAHTKPRGAIGSRTNPFQRLMVRPFEHLLAGECTVFQRVYLAHYFEFLGFAFDGRLERFEAHCRSIVQALKVVHGPALTWEQFYADPRTVRALQAALSVMVGYLDTLEGQRVWVATLIRPASDQPQPSLEQIAQIRRALVETARGLDAADRMAQAPAKAPDSPPADAVRLRCR